MSQAAAAGGRPLAGVAACVFDAYGTLLDVHSAVAAHAGQVGPKAGELSALWRRKQLEYTWLRTLMRDHADFQQLTEDALDHALAALEVDPKLRAPLLAGYRELAAYPEVGETLARLRARGLRLAVLSNATPAMLEVGLRAAGLGEAFEAVLSVEELRLYKPAPEVYLLAARRLGLAAGEIAFFSANAWDAHGAARFGFRVVWVNRSGQAPDRLPGTPVAAIADLAAIEALV